MSRNLFDRLREPSRHLLIGRLFLVGTAIAVGPLSINTSQASEAIREEVKKAPEPVLTKPPTLLHFEQATYPPNMLAEQKTAAVLLQVDIDEKGIVSQAVVLESPDQSFSDAAIPAVKRFRFSPAEINGKPSPIRIRYTYRFELKQRSTTSDDGPEDTTPKVVIKGRVRERGTRVPVVGAAVIIETQGIEVRTDSQGRFDISALSPASYSVKALSPDFQPEIVTAQVRQGEQTNIDFYLTPKRVNPYETVVRGKRRVTTVSRISLKQEQLTSVPGTFGDPIRVIQNLPGLARTPFVGGAILIRGAAPQDSGVYLDGVRIPLLFHFLGGPSVINPQFLRGIDYYPGNADVRYGRLTAGVVDVTTADTFTKEWHGSAKIDLLDASVFLNAPISENVSVAGAFRRSYIDAILPLALDAAGQEATTVLPAYYDYQLRNDIRISDDNRIFILGFGSFDDLRVVSNEPDRDENVDLDSEITFHRLHLQWKYRISSSISSRLSPYFGYDSIAIGLGDSSIKIKTWVGGVREDLEIKVNPELLVRTGLDVEVRHSSFDSLIPIPPDYRNPVIPDQLFTRNVQPVLVTQALGGVAAYADAVWQTTDNLQLIGGLRLDTMFYFGNVELALSPRGTIRYKLFRDTTLKGAAGLFAQAPPPAFANDTFGNPDLSLEKAAQFSVGFEQQFTAALNLDAQLYYIHRFDSAVASDRLVVNDGGGFDRVNAVSSGLGRSYGLELLFKHEVTRYFYGWLAYTLSWAERQQEEDGDFERFTFDQRHILTLVASFRLGGGWEIGGRFRLVSGRPEPDITDGIFDNDVGRYRGIELPGQQPDGPLFHQLDLRVEKTWFFEVWRLAVFLDIQNIYNSPNPEATLYDYRFRESGPLRGIPILPTFGVKGSF